MLPLARIMSFQASRAVTLRALALFAMTLLLANLCAPAITQESRKFDPQLASKYASITAWIGFWEAESITTSHRRPLPAFYRDTVTERTTFGEFRITRQNNQWDPRRGMFCWEGTGREHQFSFNHDLNAQGPTWGHDLSALCSGIWPVEGISLPALRWPFFSVHPDRARDAWMTS